MTQPDSLLTATKKLADAANLPWPHVQKFYRALQQEQTEPSGPTNWLPKSAGRKIWHAHPHFISRLIVALAAAPDSTEAREAVEWTRLMTPMGRNLQLTEGDHAGVINPLESTLSRYLVDPEATLNLDRIEFDPGSRMIVIRLFEGEPIIWLPGNGAPIPSKTCLIRTRTEVDGDLFMALAKGVVWRRQDQAPLHHGDEADD